MIFLIFFTLFIIFLILEIYGYKKYKRSIFSKKNLFIPHFFCHYILNPDYISKKINVSKDNFRIYNKVLTKNPDIYLSGDCSFFEQDLELDETLGFFLEKKNINILNPSCPHYSSLHQFNRFIFDLKNNIKPKNLIFSASVNDVLYLLNNNMNFKQDGSNTYIPFENKQNILKKINFFYSRYLIYYFLQKNKRATYNFEDSFIIKSDWKKITDKNYQIMKENFDNKKIIDILKLINFLCKEEKINLILCTFSFNVAEMNKYKHRKHILHYLKSINSIYREYSKQQKLKLIDFEKIFENNQNSLRNKWDYNKTGNKLRCNEIIKIISS